MKEIDVEFVVPAPHWKRAKEELEKSGYAPISSAQAKECMENIAYFFEDKGCYPSITYGLADIDADAIGGLRITEGFESDGSDYSLDVEFMKDGVYVAGDYGYELEKASMQEVYEFFKLY